MKTNNTNYIVELIEDPSYIHPSWFDEVYRDRNKNGEFNNCIYGAIPSMVFEKNILYQFKNKTYKNSEIDLIYTCPGTGCSIMIFRKPI